MGEVGVARGRDRCVRGGVEVVWGMRERDRGGVREGWDCEIESGRGMEEGGDRREGKRVIGGRERGREGAIKEGQERNYATERERERERERE